MQPGKANQHALQAHQTELRTEAEQRLAEAPPTDSDPATEALLHELNVHQIELEMQNEALRQAQIALEESRDRYVDLYEFAPVGYLTLNREGLIAEINLTGAALLGVERRQLLHRRFDNYIAPEDRDRWQRQFVFAMSASSAQHCELAMQHGDGTAHQARLDYQRLVSGDAPATLRMTLTDISEQAQLRHALDASEERYRLIFEKSNEAIFFGHPDGAIDTANPAAVAMFGYSNEAQMLRLGRCGVMDCSDPRLDDALQVRRLTGHFNGELRCTRFDGSVFDAQVSSSLFQDSKGRESTSVMIRDISDRVRHLSQIRQLNRILRTVSACNEDLVRARDESNLLNDICRDIVEIGGYVMAWVAVADGAQPGATHPVAWAGDAGLFQAHAQLDHDPEHAQRCLVNVALDKRRTQLCNHLHASPACNFDDLAALGVQSMLALPLLYDDQIHGVLTILSAQMDGFDVAEVSLMEELAADLAYGISALRTSQDRDRYIERFERALQSTITAMARTLEMRDPYTAGHQQRVSALAVVIAQEMGIEARLIEGLKFGGMIHDIGKIGVPAEILAKPGRLTRIEYQLIQQHPEAGSQLVADIDFPWPMAEMIAQHHERLDGSGYPAGLKGDEIVLEARILAVADVVEAMSSHRPYRASLGMEAALAEIESGSGRLYDADVAAACLKVVRENGMHLPE